MNAMKFGSIKRKGFVCSSFNSNERKREEEKEQMAYNKRDEAFSYEIVEAKLRRLKGEFYASIRKEKEPVKGVIETHNNNKPFKQISYHLNQTNLIENTKSLLRSLSPQSKSIKKETRVVFTGARVTKSISLKKHQPKRELNIFKRPLLPTSKCVIAYVLTENSINPDKASMSRSKMERAAFSNEMFNAMFTVAESSLVTTQDRIAMAYVNRAMLKEMRRCKLLVESYEEIAQQLNELDQKIRSYQLNYLEKQIMSHLNAYPSSTAQIALSVLIKDQDDHINDITIKQSLLKIFKACLHEPAMPLSNQGDHKLISKISKVFNTRYYTITERKGIIQLIDSLLKSINSFARTSPKPRQVKCDYLKLFLMELKHSFSSLQYLPEELTVDIAKRRHLEQQHNQLKHFLHM